MRRQHELKLLLARMAGDMHQRTALVVHVAAELCEAVDDLLNGLLIAGDRRCGDDHRIALMDGERLVLAVGHAESAESGSPWEPVHMTTILSSGRPLMSKASTRCVLVNV